MLGPLLFFVYMAVVFGLPFVVPKEREELPHCPACGREELGEEGTPPSCPCGWSGSEDDLEWK